MLLFLWIIGSVSGYYDCPKTGRYIDYYLGLEAEYYWGDESEDAVEWWAGETDDDGNCLEPLNVLIPNSPLLMSFWKIWLPKPALGVEVLENLKSGRF